MKSDMVTGQRGDHLALVLPVYNEDETIKDCLDAILASSQPLARIIVVNNNCTDNTMAIIESYAKKLNIDVVNETQQGVRFARVTGWRQALEGSLNGWVLNIDADTQIRPNLVQNLIDKCDDTNTDGASCRFDVRGLSQPMSWSRGLPLVVLGDVSAWAMNLVVLDYHRLIGLGWPLFGSCSVVSKAALSEVIDEVQDRCINYDIHEDLALSFALKQKGYKTAISKDRLASIANRRVVSVRPAWQRLRSWPLTLSIYGYRARSLLTWVVVALSMAAVALLQVTSLN